MAMQAMLDQADMSVCIGDAGRVDALLPAYQYGDILDNEPSHTKQCWIPAKPGSKFCVHFAWNGKAGVALKKQAGLFCILYIDELEVERAFMPLKGINKSTKNREWEITGKYYRGPKGPTERPFKFMETETTNDVDVLDASKRGTIRVVLYWAKPDPTMVDPVRDLSKEAADTLALELKAPVGPEDHRLLTCVGLGAPRESGVEENNMKVREIDDEGYKNKYTFIFHYAHPDYLGGQGIIPPKISSSFRTHANA